VRIAAALVAAVAVTLPAGERTRVVGAADAYFGRAPLTIASTPAPRSTGGLHDFFSEGDYWWPDPKRPGGPYIRRDGESNPDNFVEHRRALMRVSVEMPALTAAWKLTGDARYAAHARAHLRAWFADAGTRMNPRLTCAQAIHGVTAGRGTGDDTIVLPPSEIGELAAFARRSGRTWLVAVLNGPAARSLKIDLGFLGRGRYDALVVRDKPDDPAAVTVEKTTTTAVSRLTVALRPSGGFVARLNPSPVLPR
jgi:hypothetical protein